MVNELTLHKQYSPRRQFRVFGRKAARRLKNILRPDETIYESVYGFSNDGTVLLTATNQRLILIDTRFLFTSLENIQYGLITHQSISRSKLSRTITLHVGGTRVVFSSFADARLKALYETVQLQRQQHPTKILQLQEYERIDQLSFLYTSQHSSV